MQRPHTDNSLAKHSHLCFDMYHPFQSLLQRCDVSKIRPAETTHRRKPGKTSSPSFRYVSAPSVPHPALSCLKIPRQCKRWVYKGYALCCFPVFHILQQAQISSKGLSLHTFISIDLHTHRASKSQASTHTIVHTHRYPQKLAFIHISKCKHVTNH